MAALLIAGGAVIVIGVANSEPPVKYDIIYDLDGGTLPDDAPTQYVSGRENDLPFPYKDGMIFTGWCSDEARTMHIETIPSDAEGEFRVYATWDTSLVGTGIVMSLNGTVERYNFFGQLVGTAAVTGTLSFDYVHYEYGKGYYLARSLTTSTGGIQSTNNDGYWSQDVSDMEWTVSEEKVTIETAFGEKECEVWTTTTSGGSETQYIGAEDGELYRIVNRSTSRALTGPTVETDTYDLVEKRTFDASRYYTLKAYEDAGITITGDEGISTGSRISLTANESDGYEFLGWYDVNGRLVSRDRTYEPGDGYLLSDMTLYARSTAHYGRTYEISYSGEPHAIITNQPLTDIEWSVERDSDKRYGSGQDIAVESAGWYDVTYSGKDSDGNVVYGYYKLLVTGAYTFSWTYSGHEYSVSLDIASEDYFGYANSDVSRGNGKSSQIRGFVTYEDPYIVSLAHQFETMSAGMTPLQRANLVLSYTQAIPYMYDSDFIGIEEYWKFALETVLDGSGDCEDTSILYAAIMKALNYDTAVMTLYAGSYKTFATSQNHCVGLVAVDGLSESVRTFVKEDSVYYFCETTSVDHSVGDIPWGYIGNTTITKI